MSRYEAMFERLGRAGEAAFGGFLMLGDPDRERSADLLEALVAGGADMVEVGIPFSDPVADGPVIQASADRALAAGVRTGDCIELIAAFRARHPAIPVGVLTYANIVIARRVDAFCAELGRVGADSLLVADVPSIEAAPFAEAARAYGIDLVMIAASNTPDQTLATIAAHGRGYTYCVARAGVTGTDAGPAFDDRMIARLRALDAPPPVLGFGISIPDHVRAAVVAGAAGVISGSAIVALARSGGPKRVREFVSAMKAATRAGG